MSSKGCETLEMESFGEQVRLWRIKRKLTQVQLAARLHVTVSTVQGWERGRHVPDVNQASRVAGLLAHEFVFEGDGWSCVLRGKREFRKKPETEE